MWLPEYIRKSEYDTEEEESIFFHRRGDCCCVDKEEIEMKDFWKGEEGDAIVG